MAHPRLKIPAGNGELATQPAYSEWAAMARLAPALIGEWDAQIAGVPVQTLRIQARSQALEAAKEYTRDLGLPIRDSSEDLLVVTGHQPELFHPGVWAKHFLLQRVADELGAQALDLVVDSDAFDSVAFAAPCIGPEVKVCRDYLVLGSEDGCYACAPPPDGHSVEAFASAGRDALATLPAPAIAHHFDSYCECLADAAKQISTRPPSDLAAVLTRARRAYEMPAGTNYLELAVTRMARTPAYSALLAHIILDAERFAGDFNKELALYRQATNTRSKAQPFPDLEIGDSGVELPLWAVDAVRRPVYALTKRDRVHLVANGEVIVDLPADSEAAVAELERTSVTLAPRALTLTLFTRMLLADLFIHGVGGARYDALTDGLARRYFGIELPAFSAASLTMHLPLGMSLGTEDDVVQARERLNRLKHNPDVFLADVEFDSADERDRALALSARKQALVTAIGEPGADKKVLGQEIREVNEGISQILRPVADEFAEDLQRALREDEASGILADRSYPFCLWSPLEVQDKVM